MPTNPNRLRRYLLGEAAEADSDALERDYFAREEVLDEVAAAEDDLIDDYLSGSLAGEVRARFETHYLSSPVHRRRLAAVRALRRRAGPRRSVWTAPLMSLAAALVVSLLGGFWWYRGVSPGAGSSVSVTLPAILLRDGGGAAEARLDADVITLVLRFEAGTLPAPPPLEAVIRTVEGSEIWRGPAAPVESPPGAAPRLLASADVPAAVLKSGDYVVTLIVRGPDGAQELQRAALRVIRE